MKKLCVLLFFVQQIYTVPEEHVTKKRRLSPPAPSEITPAITLEKEMGRRKQHSEMLKKLYPSTPPKVFVVKEPLEMIPEGEEEVLIVYNVEE